jgi:outer membrane protein W
MKKIISALVLCVLVAGGSYAIGFGGGLLFDFSGNNGVQGDVEGSDYYYGIRNTSFGGYAFFDFTYVEAGLYYAYGSITDVYEVDGYKDSEKLGSVGQFGFNVIGKFPIELDTVTIFPMLGVSYNMVLSFKYTDGEEDPSPDELNQFGILGGMGVDFGLTDNVFLRLNGLLHFRFTSKYQKYLKSLVTYLLSREGYDSNLSTTIGMGFRFNVAIGYKF